MGYRNRIIWNMLGVVVHTSNPSSWEAEAGGLQVQDSVSNKQTTKQKNLE
jgi:hypothetical protein